VLPKIEASRDADAPDVPEVVTKIAESNPQKLRQIGLNYDIANAKGLVELTDEEKKKQEQREKENAEKKKKKAEQDVKEKADFETWKQDEKAEYEAWKKEKTLREAKEKSKDVAGSGETKEDAQSIPTPNAVVKDGASSPATGAEEKTEVDTEPVKTREAEKDTEAAAAPRPRTAEDKVHESSAGNPHDEEAMPTTAPLIPNGLDPSQTLHPGSVAGDILPAPRAEGTKLDAPADNTPKPWNAVCVLGLRVYSQDPEVSIKLVKPKDVEEGAILDVGGSTAGATM
jgi:hypothetical protein